jgi:hypothetical protein
MLDKRNRKTSILMEVNTSTKYSANRETRKEYRNYISFLIAISLKIAEMGRYY